MSPRFKAVIRAEAHKYRIMLLDFVPVGKVQGDLWTTPDTAHSIALIEALDSLNGYCGAAR